MRKRGLQLAISTIVLLILGLLILIAFVLLLTGQFENFINTIRGYSGSDIDNLSKLCQTQCDLDNKYSFCCEEKRLGKEEITCQDSRLDVDCGVYCSNVCGG